MVLPSSPYNRLSEHGAREDDEPARRAELASEISKKSLNLRGATPSLYATPPEPQSAAATGGERQKEDQRNTKEVRHRQIELPAGKAIAKSTRNSLSGVYARFNSIEIGIGPRTQAFKLFEENLIRISRLFRYLTTPSDDTARGWQGRSWPGPLKDAEGEEMDQVIEEMSN